MRERAETALEDPEARLERALIEQFLQARGESLASVATKAEPEQRALLAQAMQYAAVRLAEIDARALYVHQIHGGKERS
jgi:lambda repressor-like predicted transcriptional regulator